MGRAHEWGLFARRRLERGTLLGELCGRVCTGEVSEAPSSSSSARQPHAALVATQHTRHQVQPWLRPKPPLDTPSSRIHHHPPKKSPSSTREQEVDAAVAADPRGLGGLRADKIKALDATSPACCEAAEAEAGGARAGAGAGWAKELVIDGACRLSSVVWASEQGEMGGERERCCLTLLSSRQRRPSRPLPPCSGSPCPDPGATKSCPLRFANAIDGLAAEPNIVWCAPRRGRWR